MLRSFRVANHKSFRDEAELLLTPAYDKSRPVVPVAGIFGANASGKSNLLDALRWLQAAVLDSYRGWPPGSGVPRSPFRLDHAMAKRPSEFCISVSIDNVPHTYGVEVDDGEVLGEWLYAYPHNRRRRIFDRQRREIKLGSTVPDYRARGSFLAKNTRTNALFLTVAAHSDLAEVEPIFRWFQTELVFALEEEETTSVDIDLMSRLMGADRDRVIALVQAADLGIIDVTVRRPGGTSADMVERLVGAGPPEVADHGTELWMATGSGKSQLAAALAAEQPSARFHFARPVIADTGVVFHHGTRGGPLGIDEQSAGTKGWLRLVLHALRVLDSGGVLVVDEVDASLHPHLTSHLISLFHDGETNPHHAQLMFTSHDATLLDDEVLGRDEIWFVEKDPDTGATRLYPLTDFHPRKNENVEGRYLAGGYGAVPMLTHARFHEAMDRGSPIRAAA